MLGHILYILYKSPLYQISQMYYIMSHFYADDTQFNKRFKLLVDGAAQLEAYPFLSSSLKGLDDGEQTDAA